MNKLTIFILTLFLIVCTFAGCGSNEDLDIKEMPKEIKLTSNDFIGKDYFEVWEQLEKDGFTNITTEAVDGLTSVEQDKDDTVEKVSFDGDEIYDIGAVYMSNVEVIIYYHNIKTVYAPFSSDERPEDELFESIKKQFEEEGFTNIKEKPIEDLIFGWLTKDGEIESIAIDGEETFDDYTSFNFDTEVVIKYHTFPKSDDSEDSKSEDTTEEDLEDTKEPEKPRKQFYSTNDYETAKKGTTGVFSYKKKNTGYDVYWIIDLDEGYAYNFSEGNDNPVCDKYKISSGHLNDKITLNINGDGYKVTWYLHFKYKSAPETLVLNEHLGLGPMEFSTTSLDDALSIRNTKTIKTY